ncbi:MAG TPA: FHA domain-containing protein [Kofleriaceae bacterium]
MISIIITGEDGTVERHVFDEREVTIGRTDKNHLALPAAVISQRHARIVEKDGRYILVDLKSMNGTYVNGRKITAPLLIRPGDRIAMGNFVLELAGDLDGAAADTLADSEYEDDDPTIDRSVSTRAATRPAEPPPIVGRDAIETRLLAAIASRDEASRVVYADWLEERGESDKAEFLRVQQELIGISPDHPAFHELGDRLRALAPMVEVAWRFAVARPAIERCDVKFEFQCPKEWGSLARTPQPHVRYCNSCERQVHYAVTVDLARNLALRGECVVVDVVPLRRHGDLDPPPPVRLGGMMAPPPLMNPPPPRRK